MSVGVDLKSRSAQLFVTDHVLSRSFEKNWVHTRQSSFQLTQDVVALLVQKGSLKSSLRRNSNPNIIPVRIKRPLNKATMRMTPGQMKIFEHDEVTRQSLGLSTFRKTERKANPTPTRFNGSFGVKGL